MINENEFEFDLIEIIKDIINHKWKVIIITGLSFFIGISYLIYNKPKFETEIEYIFNTSFSAIPPEKEYLEISFYSLDLFSNWKKMSDDKILKFEVIDNTLKQNGLIIKKNIDQNLIEFKSTKINGKEKHSIIINTNKIDLLKSIYSYLEFLNTINTNIYNEKLLDNLVIASSLLRDNPSDQSILDKEILNLKKILNEIKGGELLFKFSPVSIPKLVSIPPILILFISLFIGFFVSLSFIYLLKLIENIKHELNKK